MEKNIQLIQTISDIRFLREEHNSGLYKNNPEAFNKAWAKIAEKLEKLESVETPEEKAERIRAELDYEAEEIMEESTTLEEKESRLEELTI